MRILVVANYLPDGQQSMRLFANILDSGLKQGGHESRLVRPRIVLGLMSWGSATSKWFGYFDKLIVFPCILRRHLRWAQVVHICDHSNAFYTRFLKDKPHLVTCHDLIAVGSALALTTHHKTRWTGRLLQRMILRGLSRAQHVTCVSEETRASLESIARLPETRVSVTYNGLNYPYSPMPFEEAAARLRRLGIDSAHPYLLHVGGNQWYKNRSGVVKIYAECRKMPRMRDFRLVLAGKPWSPELREVIDRERLGALVVEVTDTASEDLRALYSLASLFLFPSLAEGFGWPIVEAHACGCRVATSNRAPMTEVAGDAAIFIDPENPRAAASMIAGALETYAGDAAAILSNAARFGTAKMVDAYVSVYENVLQSARALEQSECNSRRSAGRVRLNSTN